MRMCTLIPIEYNVQSLKTDLSLLMRKLAEGRSSGVGWIEMAFASVSYANQKITAEVREHTKKLGAALSVLYYMVMIESYFPVTYKDSAGKQRNLWDEFRNYGWLSSSELERLRAYRHVRHSFAHDPEGKRAKTHYSEFTRVMNSTKPLTGINFTEDQISVDTGAGIQMVDEVRSIVQQIISRMLSTPEFGPNPRL